MGFKRRTSVNLVLTAFSLFWTSTALARQPRLVCSIPSPQLLGVPGQMLGQLSIDTDIYLVDPSSDASMQAACDALGSTVHRNLDRGTLVAFVLPVPRPHDAGDLSGPMGELEIRLSRDYQPYPPNDGIDLPTEPTEEESASEDPPIVKTVKADPPEQKTPKDAREKGGCEATGGLGDTPLWALTGVTLLGWARRRRR